MTPQHILRRRLAAFAAAFVTMVSLGDLGPRLAAQSVAGMAPPSSEGGELSPCTPAALAREPFAPASSTESRLARLWDDVGLNPESAVALASLGNEYAKAGEMELALQSFQLALDQLSTDPDLEGTARVRFRQAVEKRIRILRNPGLSHARTGQPDDKGEVRTQN